MVGFAFVPFLLLRNLETIEAANNPFSSFSSTIFQVLNFISSDYGALEPFQTASAGVRALRSLYIIVITILLLNTLIAMLNLKIANADQNAANLYYLQTASLQVEIELGPLSSAERARRDWFPDWFPDWFSYTMTETEKQIWRDYLQRNPLKWTTENRFGEEKDHVAPSSVSSERQQEQLPDPIGSSAGNLSSAVNTNGEMKTGNSSSGPSNNYPNGQTSSHLSGAETTGAATGGAHGKQRADTNQDTPSAASASQMLPDSTNNGENLGSVGSEEASCIVHTCKVCGKAGHLCKGCSVVAYCSKAHQSTDWPRHKAECRKVREANNKS